MERIESSQGNCQSREPFLSLSEMSTLDSKADINSLIQVSSEDSVYPARIRETYFAASNLSRQRRRYFDLHERADRQFIFALQDSLHSAAEWLRTVVGGQNARIDVDQ
jgi:hypothetical protein